MWFIEIVKELNRNSEEDYFYKKEKVESGSVETSKFRTKSGWVLRCNAWPCKGGRSFIHISIGEDKTGVEMFWKNVGRLQGQP